MNSGCNIENMKPLEIKKNKVSSIKQKRLQFNLPDYPLTPQEPKTVSQYFDMSFSSASLLRSKQTIYTSSSSSNLLLNSEKKKKNGTMKNLVENTSLEKIKMTDLNRHNTEINEIYFQKVKKDQRFLNFLQFQNFFEKNLGSLLILYLKEEVTKHYYQKLETHKIKWNLKQPQFLQEEVEKYLVKSFFDPYRNKDQLQIDLFMDYVDLQNYIKKEEKKLKQLYKSDPIKAMTFFFRFEKEKNVFSKKLFFSKMFGVEKKSHISRFNLLKMEIFWLKVLRKGGRKQFLSWLESLEEN